VASAVAAAHLVVPLLMFGISRFRAPLDPLILVFAALACAPHSGGKPASGGILARAAPTRRAVWVAAALAALLCVTLAVMAPVVDAALRATW